MEGAFFEGEEVRGGEVGAGAFGENEYGLALGAHCCGGICECCEGIFAVGAVDEDSF